MTAPSATARGTPTGIPLQSGYKSLITISSATTICFWERTVKPPAELGGDAIDTRHMHLIKWVTKAPRTLVELGPATLRVAYDPDAYDEIAAVINVVESGGVATVITVTFSDGSTLAFYGYLQSFEPGELADGAMPEADITIMPTNWDPVANAEEGPVMVEVAGT